jgi:putative SOS response-associated peptidase YedK
MCNDYRVYASIEDIASDFGDELKIKLNYSAEVFPGYTGLAIAERELRAMRWASRARRSARKRPAAQAQAD